MNKIFITGGAGYVGAVLVPHLLEADCIVTVLDLMIYGDNLLKKDPLFYGRYNWKESRDLNYVWYQGK